MSRALLAPAFPDLLRADPRWFDNVPKEVRVAFVREHCMNVFFLEGQTCVIISYPRPDRCHQVLKAYDMDGGRIVTIEPEEVRSAPKGRTTAEDDWTRSDIFDSRYACEAEDIQLFVAELLEDKKWGSRVAEEDAPQTIPAPPPVVEEEES